MLKTNQFSIQECVDKVLNLLVEKGVVPKDIYSDVKELFVPSRKLEAIKTEAEKLPSLAINEVDLQWIQVLSEGWATPLSGFMTEKEYLQCLHFGCLLDGTFS